MAEETERDRVELHVPRVFPASSDLAELRVSADGRHVEVHCLLCRGQLIGKLDSISTLNTPISLWNDHCDKVRQRKV